MSARAHDIRVPRRKPQLRVVHKRRSRKLIKRDGARRGVSVLIGGGIAAVAIVAAILLEQVVLVQSTFQLSEIRNQLESAEAKHEVLVLEAAKLDSAARIEQYARQELGMVDPAPEALQYIVADIKPPKRLSESIARDERPAGNPYAYGGAP